jgi:hypothetical protein
VFKEGKAEMPTATLHPEGEEPHIAYSDTERKMFKLLAKLSGDKGKPVASTEFVRRWYILQGRWDDDVPVHANGIVRTTIHNLMVKMRRNEEASRGVELLKSKRSGPYPIQYIVKNGRR